MSRRISNTQSAHYSKSLPKIFTSRTEVVSDFRANLYCQSLFPTDPVCTGSHSGRVRIILLSGKERTVFQEDHCTNSRGLGCWPPFRLALQTPALARGSSLRRSPPWIRPTNSLSHVSTM